MLGGQRVELIEDAVQSCIVAQHDAGQYGKISPDRALLIGDCSQFDKNAFELPAEKFESDGLSHDNSIGSVEPRVNLSALLEDFAADQHAADLGGAGADLVELGVAQ